MAVVLGLTGPSGSGKSAAARLFAQSGFAVIDADKVAREVMEKGGKCLEETAAHFGREVLLPDGSLDRRKVADIVFSDKSELNALEAITYPHILRRFGELIDEYGTEHEHILLDAPTLFEAGADKLCSCVVCVVADEDVRTERIMQRDNLTEEQARSRIGSQRSEEFFREKANYIIENNSTSDVLIQRTRELIRDITERFDHEKKKKGSPPYAI